MNSMGEQMRHLVVIFFTIIFSAPLFAEDTDLKLYRPFDDAMSLIIKEKIKGQCWQQSQRIKREDAWRCVAETQIYDPCFIKEYGSQKEAVCPKSPWLKDSVQIKLDKPVDNSAHLSLDMSEAFPWAMELATGEKCQAVDEGEVYDGLQVHYLCDNQTVLVGRVQRCNPQWSILHRTTNGVQTATISKAWF